MFRANLTGLFPDVNYTLQVYPYNEAGEGSVDEKTKTTHQERKSWSTDGEKGTLKWLMIREDEEECFR